MLQLAVIFVLVIACVNLANLMLVRTISRGHEFAVRRALGAARSRIVRQVLTECGLLCVAGSALALVVAYWLNRALLGFVPPDSSAALPNLRFHPDRRLAMVMVLVSAGTVMLSGLLPALRATGSSVPGFRIRGSSAGRGQRVTSRVLAVAEVALSTFLVVGAGLFARTLWNLWSVDAGFETRDAVVADLAPPQGQGGLTWSLLEDLRDRAVLLPGVRSAGISAIGQMTGYGIEFPVHAMGETAGAQEVTAYEQRITPGFLSAMGIEVRDGRDFNEHDAEDSPQVAIVNEAFVRQFLPAGSPLGQRFGTTKGESDHLEIVGVARDSKWLSLREGSVPMYYRPIRQRSAPSATLVVSAPGVSRKTERALSELGREFRERLSMTDIVPFSVIVDRTLGKERMLAYVSAALGLLALVVVSIGLYGLIAYDVAQRTREIGVRLALGATRGSVALLVMRETAIIMGIGLPLGVVASRFALPAAKSLLFGLEAGDAATLAGGAILLTAVAALATYLPVRRSTRIEPFTALRVE
jgi:predicted permease